MIAKTFSLKKRKIKKIHPCVHNLRNSIRVLKIGFKLHKSKTNNRRKGIVMS
jgi:hypothetical protein